MKPIPLGLTVIGCFLLILLGFFVFSQQKDIDDRFWKVAGPYIEAFGEDYEVQIDIGKATLIWNSLRLGVVFEQTPFGKWKMLSWIGIPTEEQKKELLFFWSGIYKLRKELEK